MFSSAPTYDRGLAKYQQSETQGNIENNAKYPECETDGTRNRYSKGYKQFQIV